jgi:hypothetical protein
VTDRTGRFDILDELAARLLTNALRGEPILTITEGPDGLKNSDRITVTLTDSERSYVNSSFDLTGQQAHGAWYVPEDLSLKLAPLTLPFHTRHHAAHAFTLAADDVARTKASSSADVLLAWAVLLPTFETVLGPMAIRSAVKARTADEQRADWAAAEQTYRSIGLDPELLGRFRYGGGWSKLTRHQQQQARAELVDALISVPALPLVSAIRTQRINALHTAFVKKAKRGTPLARSVLTKALSPTLSAYFSGDWLAFLDYLDVAPNPDEEIITALPEPKIVRGGNAKLAQVAAEQRLPVDEVAAILAAYLGQSTAVSPVDERVEVMTSWWQQFDAAHARQRPGMPALWGLVDEGYYDLTDRSSSIPRLYRHILDPQLSAAIDRLWDGAILPRWPERIVSEPNPHRLMAEAFGPAIRLWHGIALTAWYACQGGMTRTTLGQLTHYHRRELAALEDIGTPVDSALFADLATAESRLGEPQQHWGRVEHHGGVTISTDGWQTRDGFEMLRDIITTHRRRWAEQHLAVYLHHRWHTEVTTAAHDFHRHTAAKGKPPTFKQFAAFAAPAANHWFCGDLAGLYAALGVKAPGQTHRIDLLPVDAHRFAQSVYAALGGTRIDKDMEIRDQPTSSRMWALAKLASQSVYYVQQSEALGRSPEPREFGADRYTWPWDGGIEEGWPIYVAVIERVRRMAPAQFEELSASPIGHASQSHASAPTTQLRTLVPGHASRSAGMAPPAPRDSPPPGGTHPPQPLPHTPPEPASAPPSTPPAHPAPRRSLLRRLLGKR